MRMHVYTISTTFHELRTTFCSKRCCPRLDFGLGIEITEVALIYREEGSLLLVEAEFDFTHGAVAVLLDEYFRDTRLVRTLVHFVLAVDEHDDVRVLFDRAGVAEVREPRTAAALLDRAGKLRECEDRYLQFACHCFQRTRDLGDLLHEV